jgi:cytochrome bd-type quinol oxidase subunit 2
MDALPALVVRLVGPILLLGPPVAYYVYRDVKRRGESYPLLRAVGSGLFGLVGLFAYLALRESGPVEPRAKSAKRLLSYFLAVSLGVFIVIRTWDPGEPPLATIREPFFWAVSASFTLVIFFGWLVGRKEAQKVTESG